MKKKLEVKDIFQVQEAFKKASNLNDQRDGNYYRLQRYFDPQSHSTPLANNAGEIYCQQFISYVIETLFPVDTSWLVCSDPKVEDYLKMKLSESNFYNAIASVVKEAVIYNRSVLHTNMKNGSLHFETINHKEVFVDGDNVFTMTDAHMGHVIENFTHEGLELYEKEETHGEPATIVRAILPKAFFKELPKGKKLGEAVFLIHHGSFKQLFEETPTMFITQPVVEFMPQMSKSLASVALSAAIVVNEYEQANISLNEKMLDPPFAVDQRAMNSNVLNVGAGGITPVAANERAPTIIESSRSMHITRSDIDKLTNKIKVIFHTDLINQMKVTSISQYNRASNELKSLKSLNALSSDLVLSTTRNVLSRVVSLLKSTDSKFKKLIGKNYPEMKGLEGKMQKLELAQNMGLFLQGIAPLLQASPEAKDFIDSDTAVRKLGSALNLGEIIKSQEAVNGDRKRRAEAMAQQQQAQADKATAETNLLDSQSDKIDSELQ